jgi:exonuclease SbcC
LRQQTQIRRQGSLAETLADDLKVNHFVAYLIEEAMQMLAADASRTLQTFPDRSFSLAVEGQDFLIIDHANADEKRSVKTLSGGESFNASLALAFAFAESLADQAGVNAGRQPAVLESLFLDEGFGTLDAENLDAVAGAIEALYGGRTVGIITHIPELAQRMPARIVVTKQGNTSQVQMESG